MAIIPKIDKSSNKEPEKHGVLNIFLPVIHYTALLSICIPEMYLILYVPCIDANSNIHIHPRYTLCNAVLVSTIIPVCNVSRKNVPCRM